MQTSQTPNEEQKKKALREEYQTLTGKKAGPKWSIAEFQEKIFEFKTGEGGSEPSKGKASLNVKGNMTDHLEDNHPMKGYEFVNGIATGANRIARAQYLSDYYHLYMVPAIMVGGSKMPYPKQEPYVTKMSRQEYRDSKKFLERSTNVIVTILHQPE